MGKSRKHNKWNNQPRKQGNPLAIPQPLTAPVAVREYYKTRMSEEEQKRITTTLGVAEHAGVDKRIGYLLGTFYHIHGVQSLIWAEMSNLIDKWGLLIKGVQSTINSLQLSEDNFFKVMRGILKKDTAWNNSTSYAEDVDALFDRVTRWEGLPKQWKPGDGQRLEGRARIDDTVASLKSGILKLKEQDLEPEPKEDSKIQYAIAEMNEDETSTIIKQDITKKGLATIQANSLAKKNPNKLYIIFEQRTQVVETCRMTPLKAIQKRADQDHQGEDTTIIEIKPKKKAAKP